MTTLIKHLNHTSAILYYFLTLVSLPSLTAQHLQDGDFEQGCQPLGSNSCAWSKSWGADGSCQVMMYEGDYCLKIQGQSENEVGFVEQEVTYHQDHLMLMHLSATIKSKEIQGKGAGLNIGIYDAGGQLIMTKDYGGFYSDRWLQGSSNWKKGTLSLVVPPQAKNIKVGAILYGRGVAWFDDFRIDFMAVRDRKYNQLASDFLTAVMDTIDRHSLYRDSFERDGQLDLCLKIAGEAESMDDCYLAVEYALANLRKYGDNHSFLMRKSEVEEWLSDTLSGEDISTPEVRLMENVGYLKVPAFHSGNRSAMQKYASELHRGMSQLWSDTLKGWIVDLRDNTGGNMEPMITGLGPLLDPGNLGALKDVRGDLEHWSYRDGDYYWENEAGMSLSDPWQPPQQLPVVVLIGPQTGSSGEIVALSFIGNTKTITMGKSTWGLTTGNGEFTLADGSKIFLASTQMMDRSGKTYKGPIQPQIMVDAPDLEDEIVLHFARSWIQLQ